MVRIEIVIDTDEIYDFTKFIIKSIPNLFRPSSYIPQGCGFLTDKDIVKGL